MSLAAALRLHETGRPDEAVAALAPLAGPSGDGVIARFRRAEFLSRLGRHEEAVAEARQAHADAPEAPATAVWLAQALGEAGRFDEAAAVRHPEAQKEFVGPVADGWVALAKLAADTTGAGTAAATPDAAARRAVLDTILESRHAPIYSLALRLAETHRVAAEPRWPDLGSFGATYECSLEMQEDGLTAHPVAPRITTRRGILGWLLRRYQAPGAVRWLRLHTACGDYTGLVASIRATAPKTEDLDELELDMLIALGRLDAAEALAERLAKEAGKDASGELAIDRCRIAQLLGRPARPRDFDGFDDAKSRMRPAIAWLDCVAALLDRRPLDARVAADQVADPSHREYVEAAMLRWANRPA